MPRGRSERVIRSEPPFVGRTEQLAWLEGRLAEAAGGRPRLVLVSGEAGLGKTRLLNEFAAHARREQFWVCHGRAFQDLTFPGLPFADVLRDELKDAPEVLQRVLGVDLERLAEFARGDAPLTPWSDPSRETDTLVRHMGLFVALSRAIIELARVRPTLVVIDDLHWADGATLQQIQHLVSELSDAMLTEAVPLLIIGIHRPLKSDSPPDRAVRRLHRESICDTLDVTEFNEDEVRDLVVSLGIGRPARLLVRDVHAATRGNPLFVQEVVAQLLEQGSIRERGGYQIATGTLDDLELPEDLHAALSARTAEIGERCRDVLLIAACLGDRFDLPRLAVVSDVSEDELLQLLEEACKHRLLFYEGERFEFRHPLVRHVLYTAPTPLRRQRIHLEIAERLERQAGGPADAFEVAHHLDRAGSAADPVKLGAFARSAGEIALARLSWGDAARFHETAAAAMERAGEGADEVAALHFKAGVAYYRNMDLGPALEQYDAAISRFRDSGNIREMGRVLVEWTRAEISMGAASYGVVVDVAPLREALEEVPESDACLRGSMMSMLAEAHAMAEPDEALPLALRALELGRQEGDDRLCTHASVVLGIAQAQQLQLGSALESLERGRAYSLRSGDPWVQGWPLQRIPLILAWLGNLDDADGIAREACVVSRKLQDWAEYSLALAMRVVVAVARGQFQEADRYTRESVTMAHRSRYPWGAAQALASLASAQATRGAYAEAEAALDELVGPNGVFEEAGPVIEYFVRIYRELVSAQKRSLACASESLAVRALVSASQPVPDPQTLSVLCAGAEAAVHLGDAELAGRCYDALVPACERGVVFTSGWLFLLPRVLGAAAALNRWWERAEAHFQTALDLASKNGARPELARTYLDHARMLLARDAPGDRAVAQESVERARPILDSLGMQPYLVEVEDLAAALGLGRPDPAHTKSIVEGSRGAAPVFAALLLTDMEGFTDLIDREGDESAQEVIHAHNAILRACLRAYHGREVQHTGDGLLASFTSTESALRCAIAMQRDLASYNTRHETRPIRVRTGLHAGRVRAEEDRLFGAVVNATARICTFAEPGQILVSEAVRDRLTGGFPVIRDLGMVQLRGFAERFQLHDVMWGNLQE